MLPIGLSVDNIRIIQYLEMFSFSYNFLLVLAYLSMVGGFIKEPDNSLKNGSFLPPITIKKAYHE